MIISIVSIYDKRTETFGTPIAVNHTVQAIDGFKEGLESPQSFLHKHPTEYVLYKLGVMDDDTGELIATNPPVVLFQVNPSKE